MTSWTGRPRAAADTIPCGRYFEKAQLLVDQEQQILPEERSALNSFRTHIERLEATSEVGTDHHEEAALHARNRQVVQNSVGPSAIQQAYRQTVMAVNHFEEEYDESALSS